MQPVLDPTRSSSWLLLRAQVNNHVSLITNQRRIKNTSLQIVVWKSMNSWTTDYFNTAIFVNMSVRIYRTVIRLWNPTKPSSVCSVKFAIFHLVSPLWDGVTRCGPHPPHLPSYATGSVKAWNKLSKKLVITRNDWLFQSLHGMTGPLGHYTKWLKLLVITCNDWLHALTVTYI